MAKSIGTLKASLVLDSKGFLQGFGRAQKATQSFSDVLSKTMTASALKVGAAFFTIEKAINLAKNGIRKLIRDFVEFGKESPTINATLQAFGEFHKELKAIEKSLMEAFGPALTMVFESLAENIRTVSAAFDGFKPLLNEVAGVALYTANVVDAATDMMAGAVEANAGKVVRAQIRLRNLLTGNAMLNLPERGFVTPAVETPSPSSAASRASAAEPFRLSPLEMGTQEAASAIIRMQGGTKNTMSKEGVATIEQLKKIEANTRKRGAVIKEGTI